MNRKENGPGFFGWRVVAASFILAIFGWGLGFYGPSVYLQAVRAERGWSVSLLGSAVTTHFLVGALVIPFLPRLYARFGVPAVTITGAVVLSAGICGWATARSPMQLIAATAFTGAGWVTMGAAAVNAIVSPWFEQDRPRALSTAYNGASVGGMLVTPLLVSLIGSMGFLSAAVMVGAVTVMVVVGLSRTAFAATPGAMGQWPDGRVPRAEDRALSTPRTEPTPAARLWRTYQFQTLAAGMALGLFAQIGIIAHLLSLVAPALGTSQASLVMASATLCAIVGRTAFGWAMGDATDRRLAAGASYAIQIAGLACLAASSGHELTLLIPGVALFGFGIGNATSLPPLIAQREFARQDVSRVVALMVASAQAAYALAPASFGLVRDHVVPGGGELRVVCLTAATLMLCSIAAFLHGRHSDRAECAPGLSHQSETKAGVESRGTPCARLAFAESFSEGDRCRVRQH